MRMTQQIRFGNILTVNAGIIVQGCNAQGVMGSGIAKAIRDVYPENYNSYMAAHVEKGLHLGDVIIHNVHEDLSIYNCITQEFYGKDGRKYVSYEAIYDALKVVAKDASRYRMHVHYPMIGAGLGGGKWSIIQPIIDCVFDVHPGVQRTLWVQDESVSNNERAIPLAGKAQ